MCFTKIKLKKHINLFTFLALNLGNINEILAKARETSIFETIGELNKQRYYKKN